MISDDERAAIGERVRRARQDFGWSKEGASREAGVRSATWNRVEQGLPVRDDSLARIIGYVNRQAGEPPPEMREMSDAALVQQMEQLLEELARRLAAGSAPATQVVEDFSDDDEQTVVVRETSTITRKELDAPNGR